MGALKLIFLPNKFEKYTAGLRNLFQKLIIKNGIKENYLTDMRKLYDAEAILIKNESQPFNIENYFNQLLTAIHLRKFINNINFKFQVNISGNFIFDKKILSSLILNICRQTDFISIFELNKKILIKTKIEPNRKLNLIIKKLNGKMLCECKTKKVLIILQFDYTEKATRDFEDAYTLLKNPLSPVNFYL